MPQGYLPVALAHRGHSPRRAQVLQGHATNASNNAFASIPTVCPSVASRNPLLYQSLPIIIPFRDARLRRRKDGTDVDTTARGVVERLHRFP
jgi:hypothetical protein